jgi:murein DD-endopeptidase MepM/ murein hydrolase activator NlpD
MNPRHHSLLSILIIWALLLPIRWQLHAQTGACGVSVGSIVKVVNTGATGLKVRPCAGLSTACTPKPGSGVSDGDIGTVVGGPTTLDGYTWWNIIWENGKDGWSAEAISGTCLLQPCAASLSSPSDSARISFPQTYRWSVSGPCSGATIYLAFATSSNPSSIYTFEVPQGNNFFALIAEQWTTVKSSLGSVTTYYWTVGQRLPLNGNTIFFPRASWRAFTTETALPNIVPTTLPGWSSPLLTSKTGTEPDVLTFTTEDPIYVQWAFRNESDVNIPGGFWTTLYLDDKPIVDASFDGPLEPRSNGRLNGGNLGRQPAGTHKLKIVIDSKFHISESSDDDNSYSKTITVTTDRSALKIVRFPSNGGDVIVTPPPEQDGKYAKGTKLTFQANPAAQFQFSEFQGAFYSRNQSPPEPLEKGGSDETLEVHFSPIVITTQPFVTDVAGTTPKTIGISIPTTPSWLTVCEQSSDLLGWFICSVIQGTGAGQKVNLDTSSGDSGYVRKFDFPEITTPPFLDFPVHGDSAKLAPVTAMFDHYPGLRIGIKGGGTNLRTIYGDTYALNEGDHVVLTNPFQPDEFNYVGVSSQRGNLALQYNNHRGYDYNYFKQDVWAAFPGTVVTDDDFVDSNLAGIHIVETYMNKYHALVVKHANGYCTIYMHLGSIDADYVDQSDPNNWKPKKKTVDMTKRLGVSGNFDKDEAINWHLHFELWRQDDKNWSQADPYGEFWTKDGVRTRYARSLWK